MINFISSLVTANVGGAVELERGINDYLCSKVHWSIIILTTVLIKIINISGTTTDNKHLLYFTLITVDPRYNQGWQFSGLADLEARGKLYRPHTHIGYRYVVCGLFYDFLISWIIASNDRITDEWLSGEDLEETGCGLIDKLSQNLPGDWVIVRKTSLWINSVLAETGTEDFPNATLHCYCHSIHFGFLSIALQSFVGTW
jgi:hypothetical protein